MILALYIGESKCFSYLLNEEKVEVKSYIFSLPPFTFLKKYDALLQDIVNEANFHFKNSEIKQTIVFSTNKFILNTGIANVEIKNEFTQDAFLTFNENILLLDEKFYWLNAEKANFVLDEKEVFKFLEVSDGFLEFKNAFYNRILIGTGSTLSDHERYLEEAIFANKITQIFLNNKGNIKQNDYLISSDLLINNREDELKKYLIFIIHSLNVPGIYNFSFDLNLFVPLFYVLQSFNLELLAKFYEKLLPKTFVSIALFPNAKEAILDFKIGQKQKVTLSKNAIGFIPVSKDGDFCVSVVGKSKVDFEGPTSQKGIIFDFRPRPLPVFNTRFEITSTYTEVLKELESMI